MLLAAVLIAAAVVVVGWGLPFVTLRSMNEASLQAGSALRLAVSALSGQLKRYEPLPALISDHDDIKELLSRPGQTVVFYMGLGHLENIVSRLNEHGVPASRAAAVVEQGTQATQRVITGTLADLAQKVQDAGVESPALLIVGEVTRLHETLRWFNTTAPRSDEISAFAFTNEGRLSA